MVIQKWLGKENTTFGAFYERMPDVPLFDELNSCLSMKDFLKV